MNIHHRPQNAAKRALAGLLVVLCSFPLLGASSGPTPSSSADAGPAPQVDVISAAVFAGTSSAPTPEVWRTATKLSGVRMGRGAIGEGCVVEHVKEWVRVRCQNLVTARVDLVSGEPRDLSIVAEADQPQQYGDLMDAVFSMHPGDRRIVQWLVRDTWMDVWHGDGDGLLTGGDMVIGPMFGVALQVDWSGPEPKISLF
jgi:hypothetical protein